MVDAIPVGITAHQAANTMYVLRIMGIIPDEDPHPVEYQAAYVCMHFRLMPSSREAFNSICDRIQEGSVVFEDDDSDESERVN